jgi:uncharacterized protein (TIGR03792 family)
MVIEWLEFKVTPASREKFIQKDAEVWTPVLARYTGFLGKEIWINPLAPERVILVIRWQTKDDWQSVPQTVLEETEKKFAQQMGKDEYKMITATEYQVRKFPEIAK